ncbi:UDP-2,3-diacylglucosamine diphosphatase [Bacteroidales bacterium]|nr:UDP-2,3-diacylglucosamine diphosphatase [Bacteroidales bacterium]
MNKKIYFASDIHLGMYPIEESKERERKLVNWISSIQDEMSELYLLGDIFDFWHEYKYVIPKGFSRFMGKIAELTDKGIPVHFFTGNHDVWMYGYFKDELGVEIHKYPIEKVINGKKFLLGHGDGIVKEDWSYNILKKIFATPSLQWLFARLHPNLALWFGANWSKHSRYSKGLAPEGYLGDDNEFQVKHAINTLKTTHYDYIIWGHRHLPMDATINEKTHLINLGDWIYNFTYACFDGNNVRVDSIMEERKKNILFKQITT